MDEYYQAVRALPTWLAEPLLHIPPTLPGASMNFGCCQAAASF